MSGYTKFAIVGVGRIGNCILQELLKEKAAGIVKEATVLTRQVRYPSHDQVVHDILSTLSKRRVPIRRSMAMPR